MRPSCAEYKDVVTSDIDIRDKERVALQLGTLAEVCTQRDFCEEKTDGRAFQHVRQGRAECQATRKRLRELADVVIATIDRIENRSRGKSQPPPLRRKE